jgi:hypothetical protein
MGFVDSLIFLEKAYERRHAEAVFDAALHNKEIK